MRFYGCAGAGKEVYFLTEDLAASGKKRAVREWKKARRSLKRMIEAVSCGGIVIYRGKILTLYKSYRN